MAFATTARADDDGYARIGSTSAELDAAGGALGGPATGAMALGGLLLSPSVFVGGSFSKTNYTNPTSSASLGAFRFAPSVYGQLDEGIHVVKAYVLADGRVSAGHDSRGGGNDSPFTGRAGLAYAWSPTDDFVARLSAGYTRQYALFGSSLASYSSANSATSYVDAPVATNILGYRQFTNLTTGRFSLERKLGDLSFVRAGLDVQDLVYERPPAGAAASVNGMSYGAFVRAGFWLTPQVNVFVQGGGDWRRYARSVFDSNGDRVIGGFATDARGLVRGEIYGGLQQQFSVSSSFGAVSAPTFGARVYYDPTPLLTLAAMIDSSYASVGAQLSAPSASTANTLQTRVQAEYNFLEYLKAAIRGGFAQSTYSNKEPTATAWTGGIGVSYTFWRNTAINIDYQFSRHESGNGASTGVVAYSENIASMGVTYNY
ncbi:hypothetical protein CCR94_08415 [Rhodoblastus sphagnicola]|uniref:Outer membrane protein beta-barrel domain-containing protein n=1 Tax=Rhodoblastus sphagnicola TaxID=333368 RepID=A0A2S6NAP9_9HYPH|nr:hypothetical protein CCR94_08415 [Rhodoblastus sphagnicola]